MDLTEFEEATKRPHGNPCGISRLLTDLDTEQAAKLEAAMAQPTDRINHKAISTVLDSWGHRVSRNIISHHRNGGCSCA